MLCTGAAKPCRIIVPTRGFIRAAMGGMAEARGGRMVVSSGYRKNGFDAYGGKVLRKEDMAYWMDHPQRTDPDGVELGLDGEVEEVEPDFFELLPTIRAVWMENPACRIRMTGKTARLFQDNRVLLRGVYDSSAERLARGCRLRFLHLDVQLASAGDYYGRGNDVITLRFHEDGSAYLHQDCRCQGISAGSVGGGETSFDLPGGFYRAMAPEEIAAMCWGSCRGEILGNGRLAAFMEKARAKGGVLLDFTEGSRKAVLP